MKHNFGIQRQSDRGRRDEVENAKRTLVPGWECRQASECWTVPCCKLILSWNVNKTSLVLLIDYSWRHLKLQNLLPNHEWQESESKSLKRSTQIIILFKVIASSDGTITAILTSRLRRETDPSVLLYDFSFIPFNYVTFVSLRIGFIYCLQLPFLTMPNLIAISIKANDWPAIFRNCFYNLFV